VRLRASLQRHANGQAPRVDFLEALVILSNYVEFHFIG